jgi:hypothetical protein
MDTKMFGSLVAEILFCLHLYIQDMFSEFGYFLIFLEEIYLVSNVSTVSTLIFLFYETSPSGDKNVSKRYVLISVDIKKYPVDTKKSPLGTKKSIRKGIEKSIQKRIRLFYRC